MIEPKMTILPGNDNLTMSSREIAEMTGKRHAHVLRDIEKVLQAIDINAQPKFGFSNTDANGRA